MGNLRLVWKVRLLPLTGQYQIERYCSSHRAFASKLSRILLESFATIVSFGS